MKATLELMSQKDFEKITTRDILEKSEESNSSAISYHFGSKDNLIREALKLYFSQMRRLFVEKENDVGDPQKNLTDLCRQLIMFIGKNPGLEKNMLLNMISNKGLDPDFSDVMKKNVDSLKKMISRTGCKNNNEISFKAISLMSSLIYPFLLSHYGSDALGMDYSDDKTVAAYLRSLIKGILG